MAGFFLERYSEENRRDTPELTPEVIAALQAYDWPGNVRELENCVQKAVVLAPGTIFIDELVPPTVRTYSENLPQASRLATAAPQPSPLEEASSAALPSTLRLSRSGGRRDADSCGNEGAEVL